MKETCRELITFRLAQSLLSLSLSLSLFSLFLALMLATVYYMRAARFSGEGTGQESLCKTSFFDLLACLFIVPIPCE